jgi:hypothetical protein
MPLLNYIPFLGESPNITPNMIFISMAIFIVFSLPTSTPN